MEGREEGAVCVEYQLQPRSNLLSTWFAKVGALNRQLGLPVLLLAVYLEKGDRSSFPNSYSVELAGLSSNFQFPVVRLWEHAERIRTRPQDFEGEEIPAVLISGDHAKVAQWRREQARALTAARRPDLLKR